MMHGPTTLDWAMHHVDSMMWYYMLRSGADGNVASCYLENGSRHSRLLSVLAVFAWNAIDLYSHLSI